MIYVADDPDNLKGGGGSPGEVSCIDGVTLRQRAASTTPLLRIGIVKVKIKLHSNEDLKIKSHVNKREVFTDDGD